MNHTLHKRQHDNVNRRCDNAFARGGVRSVPPCKRDNRIDIKTGDNRYHSRVKVSKKSVAGRYSPELAPA